MRQFIQQGCLDNIALFEYHDEILAPSFHLDRKVDSSLIHQRFLSLKSTVDTLLAQKIQDIKQKIRKGYVIAYDDTLVEVRPYLCAPDIDPIISIPWERVIGLQDR
ncbi:MAG: hypothetical protein GXP45_05780 [bacterium]|nr:hypothetical protein [bacterium]